MSLWIESHQDLANHPKLKRLCRKLGVSKQEAIGYLHMMWWWALSYAPTGEIIPPYDTEDLAGAAEYEGEAADFLDAMITSGFLEFSNECVVVHDWRDYAGKLLEKRELDRKRKEYQRKKAREKGISEGSP